MPPSARRPLAPPITAAKSIELRPRGDFVEWLAGTGGTLAVTTYNSGKLALISAPAGELRASFWSFQRPMGVAVDGMRMALATRDHFWQFDVAGATSDDDANVCKISPREIFATGRLDGHDVAFDRRGALFANTRFNCVARPSERVHFRRYWTPPFMAADRATPATDCCHLNGIGVRAGRLAMATAFCERNEPAGWRLGDRLSSGILIDVRTGEIAARGLSLPHSPRWANGRWWLCDSGRGRLVTLAPGDESCDAVIELPGFTRGLTFVADRAVVGLSRLRPRHILDAPPVRDRWPRLRSGISLVDWRRGGETGSLEFVRGGREVYDVAFTPGVALLTSNNASLG
jgi:uncharacterized protein (TIGR03032 family)